MLRACSSREGNGLVRPNGGLSSSLASSSSARMSSEPQPSTSSAGAMDGGRAHASRVPSNAHASDASVASADTPPPPYEHVERSVAVPPPAHTQGGDQMGTSRRSAASASAPATSTQSAGLNIDSSNSGNVTAVTGISVQQLSALIAEQLDRNNVNIINRIDQLASRIDVLTELNDRFATLENQIAGVENSQPASNVNIANLAAELQDRIYRSSNIIIYGVPENQQMPDSDAVMQILLPIPGIDVTNLTVVRARRQIGDRPRFITARLASAQEALRVLRNRRLLPRGVDVTADRTLSQRDQFRAVRQEVQEFNAANPGNPKKIQYINGVPTAVFVKKNTPKNN